MTDSPIQKITFPNSSISLKIISKIKQGQYSKVMLVQDTLNSHQQYILKILRANSRDKQEINSINNEVILLTYLKKENNVINLIDYFFQENNKESFYYLLLEYCSSGSLSDIITSLNAQNNCFSDSQIWKILYDVSKGLKAIHSLKYTHRNLKTENIILGNDGNYKICDFYRSTNKSYDIINNSNRNEVILDISKYTSSNIRAPEQLDTYSGYNLNEKVDIWAVGIILYNILFDNQPFVETNFDQIRGNLLLTEEMMKNSNPKFIYLLRNMTNPNPKDRISADEIIFFIEKNWDKFKTIENIIPVKKKTLSFIGKMSDATIKLFKRHSTQFWVLKLTDKDLNPPKLKYIKCLLEKGWKKKFKIAKFFQSISRRPVHFLSSVAIKSLYVIHSYFLYGPIEMLSMNEFNFEEFMLFFINLWNQRSETTNYDEDVKLSLIKDILKNHNISKFICFYGEYLLKNHSFHKKYPFLENNFSLETTITNNPYFDYGILIEKNFLNDILTLFNHCNNLYYRVPVNVVASNLILDQIIQIISDELHFIFIIIFFSLIAYKNQIIKEKSEILLKEYDQKFFEILTKIKENTDRYKKFRFEIKSMLIFFTIPTNVSEFLININNNLKLFPNLNFNLKNFFVNSKEVNGSKLQRSYGKLIEMSKPITQLNNEGKKGVSNLPINDINYNNNDQINSNFEFSNYKFKNLNTNFDFEANSCMTRSFDFKNLNINSNCNNITNLNINNSGNTQTIIYKNNFVPNKDINSLYNNNQLINNFNFANNNNTSNQIKANIPSLIDKRNSNPEPKNSNLQPSKTITIAPQIDNLSHNIFSNNGNKKNSSPNINNANFVVSQGVQKNNYNTKLYNKDKGRSNFPSELNGNSNVFDQKINKNLNNILNEIFESNPKNEILSYEQNHDSNLKSNMTSTTEKNRSDDTDKFKNILIDLDYLYKNIKENKVDTENNKNSVFVDCLQNNLKKNQLNSLMSPCSEVKELNDIIVQQSSLRNEISNINIYNIQNNINNIELEKIANSFLFQELSKGNLHWLISSKDINMEKQIGYGGSSEVYKANYRGTDVAIKKLRILDVKEENLKEFKREVSSLIMLRHPNLVLFMGAIAEKDNICIVTEYCAGGTLFSILHQRKDLILNWELRLRILLEIAIGMNFLHTNNPPIIHRDLKSLNILLTEKIEKQTDNTKIKISDFGLSKIIKQFDNERDKMTGQLGTCHWMAPEVIDNKQYTLKADVYSYGIIIWEICSRRTPYSDMNHQQISYYVTIKKGRPDKSALPPNTPQPLIKLMENCWDDDQNNRPNFSQIISYLKKLI